MRLVTRLIAIGLLLGAIVTVFAGIVWQRGSGTPTPAATAGAHGGSAVTLQTVHHARTGTKGAVVKVNKPAAKTPPPATRSGSTAA